MKKHIIFQSLYYFSNSNMDMENYQTLEMAGPLPVKKNVQQSVINRNKKYQSNRYDKYKFPHQKPLPNVANEEQQTEGMTRNQIIYSKNKSALNQLSQRSNMMQQNPGIEEAATPRSQPKLKLRIKRKDPIKLQPSLSKDQPDIINQQILNKGFKQDSQSEQSVSPKDRISTFDEEAQAADTDLLQGDIIDCITKSPGMRLDSKLAAQDFVGTQASNMKNQTRDKEEAKVKSNDFDDDYETLNLAIDENQQVDKRQLHKKSNNIKRQLSEIQSKIQNKQRDKKSNQLSSSYFQGAKPENRRNSLISRNEDPNQSRTSDIDEMGTIDINDSPMKKINNQNQCDYKIVYINIGKGNEQELRLSHKNFEFVPRDTLQYLSKWQKQFVEGVNEQNITSLDLSFNNIQEIEGSLFMHLGKEGCQNIKTIKAVKNNIKYVSSRIKDCCNLETLKLSNNSLTCREFLPVEVLNSPNFCASLKHLYLANNDIRELPIQLSMLKSLKVLNLEHNKIRTLVSKQNANNDDLDSERLQIGCSIGGLESLEELYLGQNRLKDLPTVFQNLKRLKILGLDWFTYISQPYTLPKIVEEIKVIAKLKNTCQYHKEEKRNSYITFRQFAKGFTDNGKYNIDGGQSFQEDGRTPLHLAVIKNDQAMVNNLLKDGADPNIIDNYSYSPLGLALSHNLIAISKLILKFSQKINFKTAENSRLLLLSVEKLDIDLTEELLRQGCDPNLSQDTKTGENCLHLLVFKLSCANENILIQAENKIKEEKYSQSEQKVKDGIDQMFTQNDVSKFDNHLKTHTDERGNMEVTKAFGDTNYFLNDHKKCLRILDAMLLHGMNVNQQCQQKYTPFLLAVRLGNVILTQKLLQRLVANSKISTDNIVDTNRLIDLNLRGGYGLNTAYHLAATRTNFDILYQLDEYGADIFVRNKENKTAFQLVNNNLLMLKIVKKIEKKQIIKHQIQLFEKIHPPECKIVTHNNIYVNTGEFRQFDETLQKLKNEFLKEPRKRASIFSGQKRGGSQGGSLTRLQMDTNNSVSKRSQVHRAPASKSSKPKKIYLFDFLTENEKEYKKETKEATREEVKQSLFRLDLSPKDSERIKLSLQINNGKVPQNMPKIKNMAKSDNKQQTTIKLNNMNALARVDSSEIMESYRDTLRGGENSTKQLKQQEQQLIPLPAPKKEKKPTNSFQNFSQSEVTFDYNNNNMNLNLGNYNNYNKNLSQHGIGSKLSSKTSNEKLVQINLNASQRIDSLLPPPTPFGKQMNNFDDKTSNKVLANQNHKNIFFIKDQLFDKERIKAVNSNLSAQQCFCLNDGNFVKRNKKLQTITEEHNKQPTQLNTEDDPIEPIKPAKKDDSKEILEYQLLPIFQDALGFGIQTNRQQQEIKLLSQLKSIFNPKLKTHINVLSEIIEKLYKLKQSQFVIEQILEISIQCLQIIEFTGKNTGGINAKQLEIKNRQAQYGFITIRAALENLQQNISCPCWMQEEIQEIIQSNQMPVRKKKPNVLRKYENVSPSGNEEPYNIPVKIEFGTPEEIDVLPSQHMMKYSEKNSEASSPKKKEQDPPSKIQVFSGPVRPINKRMIDRYQNDLSQTNSIMHQKKQSQHSANQDKLELQSTILGRKKNSMIHHKNKNPFAQFPSNSDFQALPSVQTEAQEFEGKIDVRSVIYNASEADRKAQKFEDEFNNNLTIENEEKEEQLGINSSAKKIKLVNFDPEKTYLQGLTNINLHSFQKAKFNSNKHNARPSDLTRSELNKHLDEQNEYVSKTQRQIERVIQQKLEEQKVAIAAKDNSDSAVIQDTIVVKRKNINFKRITDDQTSNPKLSIKIKQSSTVDSQKTNKKLPKSISSKKLNIQNIQQTQFVPSSKNSPRGPDGEKHFRKNSRIEEISYGIKFQEIKKSETNITQMHKNQKINKNEGSSNQQVLQ